MNNAFFVGGSLDGTFQDVAPGTKTISSTKTSHPEIPGQLSLFDSLPGESDYTVATFLIGPGVSRRIFVEEGMSTDEVEQRMGFFIADLWDAAAYED